MCVNKCRVPILTNHFPLYFFVKQGKKLGNCKGTISSKAKYELQMLASLLTVAALSFYSCLLHPSISLDFLCYSKYTGAQQHTCDHNVSCRDLACGVVDFLGNTQSDLIEYRRSNYYFKKQIASSWRHISQNDRHSLGAQLHTLIIFIVLYRSIIFGTQSRRGCLRQRARLKTAMLKIPSAWDFSVVSMLVRQRHKR